MPFSPDETLAVFGETDAAIANSRAGMLAAATPPEVEPLDPTMLSVLADSIQRKVAALTEGQFQIPIADPAEGEGAAHDLRAAVMALSQLPGLEGQVDPSLLESNAGVQQLIAMVDSLTPPVPSPAGDGTGVPPEPSWPSPTSPKQWSQPSLGPTSPLPPSTPMQIPPGSR